MKIPGEHHLVWIRKTKHSSFECLLDLPNTKSQKLKKARRHYFKAVSQHVSTSSITTSFKTCGVKLTAVNKQTSLFPPVSRDLTKSTYSERKPQDESLIGKEAAFKYLHFCKRQRWLVAAGNFALWKFQQILLYRFLFSLLQPEVQHN